MNRPGGQWTKNAVIVAALLAAGFFAAWVRFRPHLQDGARWTDGEQHYRPTREDGVRFAIWEAPERAAGTLNTSGWEGRPAVSPDGRYLVFAVGRPDLGSDLWIAEIDGRTARDARPLIGLNTAAEETAPAFDQDALWFASSRPGGAGGLDLYSAQYADGVFQPPVLAAPGLNTAADESDPAPAGERLAFASNRAPARGGERRDWDVYLAERTLAGDWESQPLAVLSSVADDREPAFASDGRALYFATDRNVERGFDLYRSLEDRGTWLAPEPIAGLNGPWSERGPAPAPDGFSLWYAVEGPDGDSDLWRARSRELFRIPGRPVGWIDLIVLLALLALALLAWLAKRWERIDVLYRCVLVSVVAHLMLLWWFRYVHPERGGVAPEPGQRSFQVQLASLAERAAAAERASRERAGQLDVQAPERDAGGPERWSDESQARPVTETSADLAAAPAPVELREPESSDFEPTQEVRAEPDSLALQEPAEQIERRTAEPAPLELASSAGPEAAEVRPDPVDPGRWSARPESATPVARASSALSAAQPAPDGPAPRERAVETGAASAAVVELRDAANAASEPRERRASESPTVALGTGPRATPSRSATAPTRRSVGRPARTSEPAPAQEALETAAATSQLERSSLEARPERARSSPAMRDPVASAAAPSAAAPAAEPGTADSTARATDAPAGIALAAPPSVAAARRGATSAAPERYRGSAARSAESSAPARPATLASRAAERPVSQPRRAELDPGVTGPNPGRAASRTAVATPAAVPADRVADARSTAAASMGLEASTIARPDRAETADGPSRWRRGRSAAEPEPGTTLLAGASPTAGETQGRDDIEHSPYRARFGEAREQALREFGGTAETERAVAQGLLYLAERQRPGGYWGRREDYDDKYGQVTVGKTGLSLLAFLGAGHTPVSETRWSETTQRAVDFLLSVQDTRTGHFGDTSAYSHGIATYALAECFALTADERLRAPLDRAVAQILRHQEDRGPRDARTGGWSYFYRTDRRFDAWPRVSVSGWQVMALESARLGGLTVADDVFERAHRFLVGSCDDRRGWIRYSHDPGRLRSDVPTLPGSTPAGLFALSLLGEDLTSEAWSPFVDFLTSRPPRSYRSPSELDFVERGHGNLYFWYYGTLALFRHGGDPWRRWNESLKSTLLPAQDIDGSWEPVSLYARRYALDTDRDRIYTTAMCVLTLEVYYRYFTPLLAVR